ncbi:MAG: hypothetical protein LBG97_08150 [Coriobacteriales bacterium]|jgi:desulfoferrodoxin|nr:hypothetical protein [Coriobacteriales bacterium]
MDTQTMNAGVQASEDQKADVSVNAANAGSATVATENEIHRITDINSASDFELKHTPNVVVEDVDDGKIIKVGIGLNGIAHPQTEEHYIGWFKVFDGSNIVGELAFAPTTTPQAEFKIAGVTERLIVQAYCNLHGVWEACL